MSALRTDPILHSETLFEKIGGGGEIRTHGALSGTAVFKTAALNRSATPPLWTHGESNPGFVHAMQALYH